MKTVSLERVCQLIAEALYIDAAEVTREASLMHDLGAESIDFLDIMFRLEKEFGVKIPRGEIERKARGGLSDEEFAINGLVTEQGLARLKTVLPGADSSVLVRGFKTRDIPSLFTAETFFRMVQDLADKSDSFAIPNVGEVRA